MSNKLKNAIVAIRECPICKQSIGHVVRSFATKKEVTAWIESEEMEMNHQLLPLPCPNCDANDANHFATHMSLIVDGKPLGEPIPLGTAEIPVVIADERAFAVTASLEEIERRNHGDRMFSKFPQSTFDEMTKRYTKDTIRLNKVDDVFKRIERRTWVEIFQELTLELPSQPNEYRKIAKKHAESALKIYLRSIIHYAQYVSLIVWAEHALERYDAWTIQYFVLNVPLPEELENIRTELIGRYLTKKNDFGSEALFGRMREISRQLEEQRNKSQSLLVQLGEQRRMQAETEKKLSEAYQRIRELESRASERIVSSLPVPPDRRKMDDYKGLIAELRVDVERLEKALIREKEDIPVIPFEVVEPPEETDISILKGRTVAIIGRDKSVDGENDVCNIIWHDGKNEEGLEHALNLADVVVCVRFISHKMFWKIREEAVEREKPIVFTTTTNIERILYLAANVMIR